MVVHGFHAITIDVTTEVEATEEVEIDVIKIDHGVIDVETNEIQG